MSSSELRFDRTFTTLRATVSMSWGIPNRSSSRQGADRIVIQLRVFRNTARAKQVLDPPDVEYRRVDEQNTRSKLSARGRIPRSAPSTSIEYNPILLSGRCHASGDRLLPPGRFRSSSPASPCGSSHSIRSDSPDA